MLAHRIRLICVFGFAATTIAGCGKSSESSATNATQAKPAESALPVQASQSDEPPFSVETDLDSYSRPMGYHIKATTNSLTINNIQVNRGNCELLSTTIVTIPFTELKSDDVPVIRLHVANEVTSQSNVYWPYTSNDTPPGKLDDWHDEVWLGRYEKELKQKGESIAYVEGHASIHRDEYGIYHDSIDDLPSDSSKFQVTRSKFPVTLKFAENFPMQAFCRFDDIIEMKIDTTVGSWTWMK